VKSNRVRFVALALAAGLSVAACSSSKSSSSSAPTTNGSSGTSGSSTGVDEAKRLVAAAVKRPTQVEVNTPLGTAVPTGKTVDWIQCSIPACTQLGDALKQAAQALGWKLNIIDGGITPETIKAAWGVAARNKHDAAIGSGFPRVVFESELQQLAAAKVPVIQIDVTDPATNGITAVVQGADAYPASGKLMADWVISDGGDKANTLFVSTSAFPVVGLRAKGFSDEYKRLCSTCKLDTLDAQVTDFGDKLNTQVVAYLQSHPDVNHVAAGVSDMITGLSGALKGAGVADKVTLMTNDINPALEQDIRNGTSLKALTMMENVNMMWQAMDVALRAIVGKPFDANVEAAPNLWIVTKDNIGDFKDPYPIVADYQAQYKRLWGG
jgi:ribose transport system substrate-binding protein